MGDKNKYIADLSINENRLNNEILEQPQKYYDYALLAAIAKNKRDDAKDDLDIKRIEVEAKIRKDKENYPTEGAVKSAVENHRKIKKLREKLRHANKELSLYEKAEKAFEQRRRMIETYVYLNVHNINSDVRIPKSVKRDMNKEASKEIKRQLQSSLGSSLKRRKR